MEETESKVNRTKIQRLSSLSVLTDISNIKSTVLLKDEIDEDKSKGIIIGLMEELIEDIESSTEKINEQACDHIHDGDNILTANESTQIEEFLIVKKILNKGSKQIN